MLGDVEDGHRLTRAAALVDVHPDGALVLALPLHQRVVDVERERERERDSAAAAGGPPLSVRYDLSHFLADEPEETGRN